jgi:hypothetical protein
MYKNVFLICLVYFQNCAAIHYGFKAYPCSDAPYESAVRISLIPLHGRKNWGQLIALPTFKNSFAHFSALNLRILVKFELQTHMEHLSSCQSGFLVACASQSSIFWVFVIFCQPLNICLFVMLYLYIYIIYCY